MARKKKSLISNWQENWSGLLIGAVIVIILALLVVNFFNRNNQQIGDGQQTDLTQQEQEKVTKSEQYKVAAGDSLSKLAEKYYGNMDYWPVLARANKIANPNVIYVGVDLQVPSKEEADQIKNQMSATTYNVKEGDTLFKIAEEMYGDGSKWTTIAKDNNLGRLPNGNPLVFAGSTIKIPR